jgi:hypothetical protein
MSRFVVSLVPRVIVLSILAVLAFATAGQANTVTWYLSGVTLDAVGSAKGSFDYDTTLRKITRVDISATYDVASEVSGTGVFDNPVSNPFVFNAAGEGGFITGVPTMIRFLYSAPDGTEYILWLCMSPLYSALGTPGEIPLIAGTFNGGAWSGSNYQIFTWPVGAAVGDGIFDDVTGGSLTTTAPVPLPPSAFLLVSGLIPLAWARRKNGKPRVFMR